MFSSFQISPKRAQAITEEITLGSQPQPRFYILLIISAMIASFGLAANSTAVVIGAMLVSPLMTPIFGIALGMLLGNPQLIGKAMLAEAGGTLLAICAACLLGMTQLTAGEATAEMLSRTEPNLLDLLVAVFAGFAGAYALVDTRLSPALPGVAIATAIVPPLATCGLCLAMGAFSGAGGALLLFLANFVSILLVALITFRVTGLVPPTSGVSWSGFARRFGLTIGGFAVVAVVLTNSLIHIVREKAIKRSIRQTLSAKLADFPGVELEEFMHKAGPGRVQVLATIRSPRVARPGVVTELKEDLEEVLGLDVDLVVRTLLAKDVTPSGSRLHVTRPDFDGFFISEAGGGLDEKHMLAEQVIREQYQNEPGFELTQVDVGIAPSTGKTLVVAYLDAIYNLSTSEVAAMESILRERLQDSGLMLIARVHAPQFQSTSGPVRAAWTSWRGASQQEIQQFPEMRREIRKVVARTLQVIPSHVHFNFSEGRRRVLIEVAGPKPVTSEDARLSQQRLSEQFEQPLEIHFWYTNQFVVNAAGYTTYDELTQPDLQQRKARLREFFGTDIASTPPQIADPSR